MGKCQLGEIPEEQPSSNSGESDKSDLDKGQQSNDSDEDKEHHHHAGSAKRNSSAKKGKESKP